MTTIAEFENLRAFGGAALVQIPESEFHLDSPVRNAAIALNVYRLAAEAFATETAKINANRRLSDEGRKAELADFAHRTLHELGRKDISLAMAKGELADLVAEARKVPLTLTPAQLAILPSVYAAVVATDPLKQPLLLTEAAEARDVLTLAAFRRHHPRSLGRATGCKRCWASGYADGTSARVCFGGVFSAVLLALADPPSPPGLAVPVQITAQLADQLRNPLHWFIAANISSKCFPFQCLDRILFRGRYMHTGKSRRDLLCLTASGAILAAGSVALLERVDAAQTTSSLRVRRNVGAMAPDDPVLEAYRQGVAAMKALPSTDKRSWSYQANIHYNNCPHGNWYFLPWHRAYLLELEAICRALLPSTSPLKTTFAVPYWEWTQYRTLSSLGGGAFTAETWNDQANPLLNTTRTVSPTASLPDAYVGQNVIDNVLAQTLFEVFASSRPKKQKSTSTSWQRVAGTAGPLEATPHNNVHNWIGGEMSDFYSPRDACFWLHHANCDRLWAEWNVRGNANMSNSLWRNFVFTNNFARPDGTLYNVTVENLTDIVALGYRYDVGGPQPAMATATTLSQLSASAAVVAEPNPIATFSVLNAQSARPRRPLVVQVPVGGAPFGKSSEIILRLLDITLVAPSTAGSEVRVFIDNPSVAPNALPAGPFYVGTFSFFGSHALHRPSSFALSLTRVVKDLLAAGHVFGNTLAVQIVPVAPDKGTAQQLKVMPAVVEVTFYG